MECCDNRSSRSIYEQGVFAARDYLEQSGYRICAMSLEEDSGWLDLVMFANQTLVFIEVKTADEEATEFAGSDEISVIKRKRCLEVASEFIRTGMVPPAARTTRFDTVLVVVANNGSVSIDHRPNTICVGD